MEESDLRMYTKSVFHCFECPNCRKVLDVGTRFYDKLYSGETEYDDNMLFGVCMELDEAITIRMKIHENCPLPIYNKEKLREYFKKICTEN